MLSLIATASNGSTIYYVLMIGMVMVFIAFGGGSGGPPRSY